MRILKLILLVIIFACTGFTQKTDEIKSAKLSLKYALDTFVDAFSHGKVDDFMELLDENVKMTSSRGANIITYKRAEIVQMLKNIRGVEQNCKTTTSFIETLPGMVKVKISMVYGSFTKNDYVTMEKSSTGWKIINISRVFE